MTSHKSSGELSRQALGELIRQEGYIAPDVAPVDPELRTGHQYCASVYSFDFVQKYLGTDGDGPPDGV
jgi:hypothetical protein